MNHISKLILFSSLSAVVSLPAASQEYVTQYKYDARGRLVEVKDNDGKIVSYALDDAGNRTSVQNSDTPSTPPVEESQLITSFTGPRLVEKAGQIITLSWTSENTSHCSLPNSGSVSLASSSSLPSNGSKSFKIYQDTSFVLTCYGLGKEDTAGITVRLGVFIDLPQPPPTSDF